MAATSPQVRPARFERETLDPGLSIPRHRHEHGYIAVVLHGRYEECGLAGRFSLEAGDVVVHRAFDSHLDRIALTGADVLNLPIPIGSTLPVAFKISDPEMVARVAERDVHAAALSLLPVGTVGRSNDWPDELAAKLDADSGLCLGSWARENGLAPETLSRGFGRAFGVSPAGFRAELRAQRALELIRDSREALAAVATDCGFADQPHLTRAIVKLTGHPPGFWRRSNRFKTGRDQRARPDTCVGQHSS